MSGFFVLFNFRTDSRDGYILYNIKKKAFFLNEVEFFKTILLYLFT